jgi:nitrile hydratase
MMAPRFKVGDAVAVARRRHDGHHRSPFYLKGHAGEVAEVIGAFRDPEKLAYHKPGLPKRFLYLVRFRQRELWKAYDGPAADVLTAEIYEHWLEPVQSRG